MGHQINFDTSPRPAPEHPSRTRTIEQALRRWAWLGLPMGFFNAPVGRPTVLDMIPSTRLLNEEAKAVQGRLDDGIPVEEVGMAFGAILRDWKRLEAIEDRARVLHYRFRQIGITLGLVVSMGFVYAVYRFSKGDLGTALVILAIYIGWEFIVRPCIGRLFLPVERRLLDCTYIVGSCRIRG